jgi:hypothetical protein
VTCRSSDLVSGWHADRSGTDPDLGLAQQAADRASDYLQLPVIDDVKFGARPFPEIGNEQPSFPSALTGRNELVKQPGSAKRIRSLRPGIGSCLVR